MEKFSVYVPIAGYIYVEVEAESEEDAIQQVFENGYKDEDVVEMDMYEDVVKGNVCYLNTAHAYAEKIKD